MDSRCSGAELPGSPPDLDLCMQSKVGLFRANPRGFAIVLVHPVTNLAQTLPFEVTPSHGPLSQRLTATSSPRRETIRSSYCYSSLAVIGATTQHVALCISSRLHLAQGIPRCTAPVDSCQPHITVSPVSGLSTLRCPCLLIDNSEHFKSNVSPKSNRAKLLFAIAH